MASQDIIKYGAKICIENGYGNWGGGYLDVRGAAGCEDNLYGISTAGALDLNSGSGIWAIESASGKQFGEAVMANDIIYFKSAFKNWEGGFLDTCGAGCQDNLYCVSTARGHDRDSGSGAWRIITDSSGGEVRAEEVVHILNGYSDWRGGFLDTRGAGCHDNRYCVSTSVNWNRDGGSTHWRFRIPGRF